MKIHPIGVVRRSKDHDAQEIEILERFSDGLSGIEDSRYIWVLYWFHKVSRDERGILQVHPRGDATRPKRGVFATRSPIRPNPIGLAKVKLVKRRGNVLIVRGLDALKGSPIVDIKHS